MAISSLKEQVRRQLGASDFETENNNEHEHEHNKTKTKNNQWSVDCDSDAVRHAIGMSFAGTETVKGEPTWEWGFQHYQDLKLSDKIHITRFFMSFPLLQDLRSNGFQLCSMCPAKNEITSFASVREYDSAVEQARWFKKLRQGWYTVVDWVTLFVYYRESLPRLLINKRYDNDTKRLDQKFDKFDEKIDTWQQQVMPPNVGLHWYVHMVGVNPLYQGQGQGKALMERLNRLADASNRVMYLEAGAPNRIFYEKMGFVVQRTELFVDPGDHTVDPYPMHLMTRQPSSQ